MRRLKLTFNSLGNIVAMAMKEEGEQKYSEIKGFQTPLSRWKLEKVTNPKNRSLTVKYYSINS